MKEDLVRITDCRIELPLYYIKKCKHNITAIFVVKLVEYRDYDY